MFTHILSVENRTGKISVRATRRYSINQEQIMDGLLFLAFWIGGASLHTLYDLRIKPRFKNLKQEPFESL